MSALAGANQDRMLHSGMVIRVPMFDTEKTPRISQARMETLATSPKFYGEQEAREGALAKVMEYGAGLGLQTGVGIAKGYTGRIPGVSDIQAPTPEEYLEQVGVPPTEFPGLGTGGLTPGTTADVPEVTPLAEFDPTDPFQGVALDLGPAGELPSPGQQYDPLVEAYRIRSIAEGRAEPTSLRDQVRAGLRDPTTLAPTTERQPGVVAETTPSAELYGQTAAQRTQVKGGPQRVSMEALNITRQFAQGLRVYNETDDRTAMPLYLNDWAVSRYIGVEDHAAYLEDLGYRNIGGGIWMRYDPITQVTQPSGYYPSSGSYAPSLGGRNYVSRSGRTMGRGGMSNVSRQLINWRIGFG
jgi:hypothetical protein